MTVTALPEVSKTRYEQTLYAEHPTLKEILGKLAGEKTQQMPAMLAKIWPGDACEDLARSRDGGHARAEQLAEVGFFQRRGSKERPVFWVPFLYRDALDSVQGPAEQ